MRHETGWLRLERWIEALLVQFRQTLARRGDLWARLRKTGQLWLQWRWTKSAWLLGEVLWRRKRPLWRRREERALSHILRGLWALPRCLLKACLLGAECLGPRLHGLLCYLCHLCEKARSGTCLLGLHLGSRHCSRLWLDSSGG